MSKLTTYDLQIKMTKDTSRPGWQGWSVHHTYKAAAEDLIKTVRIYGGGEQKRLGYVFRLVKVTINTTTKVLVDASKIKYKEA